MTVHLSGDSTLHTTDPCDLCGSLNRDLLATLDRDGQSLSTGICRRCGLVSHSQRPTEEELQAYYAGEYRQSYHGESVPSPRRVLRAWVNGQRIFRRLKSFIKPTHSIFEVGAGIGCTVKAFELNGHLASGIDPGEDFQRFSHDQLRANVHHRNLFDLPPHPQHDMMLLVHVIEHFRSPRRALEHIHKLLQPRGMLYVECPNLAAPFATRPRLFHFAHVTNFTPSSLTMLAESSGFRVVQWFSKPDSPNLEVLLEKSDFLQLNIDEKNFSRTLAAIERYNFVTYHLRPSYLLRRVAQLGSYVAEHLFSPLWLRGFVRRCARPKPREAAGHVVRPEVYDVGCAIGGAYVTHGISESLVAR